MNVLSRWSMGFALSLFVVGNVAANDSVASLGAGGIVIGKTDVIAMEQEDLFVSADKIRVSYVFRNTSDKAVETRVAFPVPEFPENPDMDLGLDTHSTNPMGFAVKVEGKTKKFETEVKKKEGNVKITHHWVQTFPANQTLKVTHEYKPAIGGEAMLWFQEEERANKIKRYCIEPDLVRWIDKNNVPDKGKIVSPRYIDYILTTGANWKGPIGKFRLTVQKNNPNEKLSVCGTGWKKRDAKTFVLEKTNFTPAQDLAVMLLSSYTFDQ